MQKTKPPKKATLVISVLVFSLLLLMPIVATAQSGASCSTSIPLSGNPQTKTDSLSASAYKWFSFVASGSDMSLELVNLNLSGGSVHQLEIYEGTCSNLNLYYLQLPSTIQPVYSQSLSMDNLITGQTYYLKVTRFDPSCRTCVYPANAPFSITLTLVPVVVAPCDCGYLFPIADTTNTCEAVCNGGFELYRTNTVWGNLSVLDAIDKQPACPWRNPNSSFGQYNLQTTPDLYNSLNANSSLGVPNNQAGNEPSATPPINGQVGYAGILAYFDQLAYNITEEREYITAPLNYTLLPGKQYRVSLKVSLAENSGYAAANIGAYLTSTMPTQNNGNPIIVPPANLQAVSTTVVNSTTWVTVSGVFTATGNESWITIGQFTTNSNAQITTHTPSQNSPLNHFAYYFIDSVSVAPYPGDITVSALPAPVCNGDTVTLIAQTNVANAYYYTWATSTPNSAVFLTNHNDTASATTSGGNDFFCIIHLPAYNGCTISDSAHVSWLPGPLTISAGADQGFCLNGSVTLTGTVDIYTDSTSWTDSLGNVLCTDCLTATVTPGQNTYYVFYAANTVTGCSRTDIVRVFLTHPNPSISYSPYVTACDSAAVYCVANIDSAATYNFVATNSSYTPVFETHLSPYCISVNWASVLSGSAGYVILHETDKFGCTWSDTIRVLPCCDPTESSAGTTIRYYNDTISSVTNISGAYIHVNGTLWIHANATFTACRFRMAANAHIIVEGGHRLRFANDSLYASCGEMWDAVEGMSAQDSIVLFQNCYLADAIRGVVSNNGAYYRIANTITFNRNLVSLTVNPYAGTHGGIVQQTTFKSSSAFYYPTPNGTLMPPYAGQYPLYGIECHNVDNITFGNPVTANNRNTFTDLRNGIFTYLTNANIYNNVFTNINKAADSKAVWCIGRFPTINPLNLTQYTVRVGGNTPGQFQKNRFTNCTNGVYTTRAMSTYVINNAFNQTYPINQVFLRGTAVRVDSCYGALRVIDVINDSILNHQNGYYGYQNHQCTARIWGNFIQRNQTGNTGCTGVMVIDNGQNVSTTSVYLNEIRNVQTGIRFLNVNKATADNNFIRVRQTTIPTQVVRAIWATNSPSVKITDNQITRETPSGQPITSQWIGGVFVAACPASVVNCNVISRIGYGIQYSGPGSTGATVFNNAMSNTYTGIWLSNGAVIGQQGSQTVASDNTWTGNVNRRMYTSGTNQNPTLGNLSPFYYRPNGNIYNPTPTLSTGLPNQPITALTTNSGVQQTICSYIQPASGGNGQNGLVANGQLSGNNTPAARWIHREGLYKQIQVDSAFTIGDVLLTTFKDSANGGNVGRYTKAMQLHSNGTMNSQNAIASAYGSVSGSAPVDQIEQTYKEVETIMLDHLLNGGTLSATEMNSLRSIAALCPYTYGNAVYVARGIIAPYDTTEYEDLCNENNLRTAPEQSQIVFEPDDFKLYPNPTNGDITIEYHLAENESGTFELYSADGALIKSVSIQSAVNVSTISLTDLSAGMYYYTLRINGEMKKSDKLVIIK